MLMPELVLLVSTHTFRKVLTVTVDGCAEIKECPFSGVTSYGRVWRKGPGKRGLECAVACNEANESER